MTYKILIVDDEKTLCRSLQKLLQSEGYEADTSTDSLLALKMLKKNFYDLIILDIRMPKMDGIGLLREVRKLQKESEHQTIAIIMTAYADEEAPTEATELGAVDYLMKPFEIDTFLNTVKKNLELR